MIGKKIMDYKRYMGLTKEEQHNYNVARSLSFELELMSGALNHQIAGTKANLRAILEEVEHNKDKSFLDLVPEIANQMVAYRTIKRMYRN